MPLFGGIEAGGTKFVCGVGTGPDDLHSIVIPTTSPEATVAKAVAFFLSQGPLDAIGIGSFGRQNKNRPIDRQPLNPPSDLGGYPQAFPIY